MNVKMEKLEKNVVKFEITVGADKFAEAVKKSYSKNAKKFNVPGFRKGKAPMNIIKKYYGEGALYEDAINYIYETTYSQVLVENDIHPVDYPSIDIVQIGEGKEFIYTALVPVVPEVELGAYKGIAVKKEVLEVTDEDVENKLKELQAQNTRVEVKEGAIKKGDIAVIDFKGYVDNVAFEGGEAKDYELEIGSGSFIDNFEDQLVGLSAGESKDINVNFPEQYGKEELNGKPAKFEVTVNSVKKKELPEINDEFASEVSEFETLEELRNSIREELVKANEAKATNEYEMAVIEAVVANANVEIPDAMVNRELDGMLQDLENRLKYQGLDIESYFKFTNTSEDDFREQMKDIASKNVKNELVLNEIAKAEKIEASEEEIREKATEIASKYGETDKLEETVDRLVKVQREYLGTQIVNEKIKNMIMENSKAI
ncbi:trigger factor [Clostridium sp. UBA1056]|uniref:trigger factor n=1 Tax=unclassified Clostridium TaxID=2614128 RepID=UPI003217BB3D